jgi:hypothetical protein
LVPFGQGVSGEKICSTLANQKQELLLAAIFVGIKFLRLISFGQQIWLPRAILVSDWLMLSKSSPLKLLGQMEPKEKICFTVANQKQELLLAAIFVGQTERNEETL